MHSDDRQRLVVIGSGWAGLYMAQYIDTRIYAVTIISPHRTSAYTPLLASAAVGLFRFNCAEESIRSKGRNINYFKATAIDVDFTSKKVQCEAAFNDDAIGNKSFDVAYDKLVICPGCKTNTFGTPGVAEHAIFMKNVHDAMILRKKIFDQLEKASLPTVSREKARELLHVAIVGGGPTGIEVTAELSDLARRELKDLYPDVAPLLQITVYDVASHILGTYDRALYEYATEKMVANGVRIGTNSIIERVDDTHMHIKGQGSVPYGILLWVTGNKSIRLVDSLQVRKTTSGLVRILTDANLRVMNSSGETFEGIYALGDAADIDGQSLPTTAEVAVQKAKYLLEELNGQGRSSIQPASSPFKYSSRGLVTYIGGHNGVAEGWRGTDLSGRRAWLSWRSGALTWTRTWRNWFAILLDIILNFLFGRDVARM